MKNKAECKACGGSGQTSYFKGASRFLLSQEECPECAGLGYLGLEDETKTEEREKKNNERQRNNYL